MTVRVGNAIGSANFIMAGLLMKWAFIGGILTGLIGGTFATVITFIDQIYSFFVPTTTKNTFPINCPLIGSYKDLQKLAKPYWIISSYSWPFQFIQKASIGFFMGTGETQLWGIAMICASAAKIGSFYLLINNDNIGNTTVYGLANNMVPSIVFAIVAILCFMQKKYRDQFQLNNSDMFSNQGWNVAYMAMKDGRQLLLKDLVLTLQKSISLNMAAHLNLGSQYQLLMYSTVQTVFGYNYGAQNSGNLFSIACGYGMRLTGSRFLGAS